MTVSGHLDTRRDGALRCSGASRRSTGATRLLTFAALFSVTCAGAARAQSYFERSNVPVGSRPNPEYDALGMHAGAFTLYPKLSLSEAYEDNVFGLPHGDSDYVTTIAPSLEANSDWGRNALDLNMRYQRDQYANFSQESTDSYSGTANGRIDIDHATVLNLTLNLGRFTEPRTSPDQVAGLSRPTQYDKYATSATLSHEFGRFRVQASVSDSTYSFFNTPLSGGGFYPEDLRDESSVSERVRLDYAQSPNLAFFVQVSPNQNVFSHDVNGSVPATTSTGSLNSSGVSFLGGVNFEVTHLITGEIGAGYLTEDYDDPRINTVSGFAFNGSLQYYPTQLVTVNLRGEHSIQTAGIPGAAATVVDDATLSADYELRRNIIISPRVGYSRYTYPGLLNRTDDRYTAGVSANYLINRYLGVAVGYSYVRQNSGGALQGFQFDDNRLTLTLTVQR